MKSRVGYYESLSGPHLRGQATEAIVTSDFLLRGIPVLVPRYDNTPYDVVVELQESFYKIQIKTAYGGPDTICFETLSTRATSSGYERRDYEGLIDYFAIYSPETDQTYLVHIDEASTGKMVLRLTKPDNNQEVGVNPAEDFLLDTKLEDII